MQKVCNLETLLSVDLKIKQVDWKYVIFSKVTNNKVMTQYLTDKTEKLWQVVKEIVELQERKLKHSLRKIINSILHINTTGAVAYAPLRLRPLVNRLLLFPQVEAWRRVRRGNERIVSNINTMRWHQTNIPLFMRQIPSIPSKDTVCGQKSISRKTGKVFMSRGNKLVAD